MEMDKTSNANSTVNTTSGGGGGSGDADRDVRLNHVNKMSHKISKPIRKHLPPTPPDIPNFENINQNPQSQPPQNNLQQPPVYNINKNDFRNVVQKLTGSPVHERPPPVSHPRPPSSRLQRIRPPPLAQISTHPPLAQGPTSGVDLAQKDGLAGCQRAVQPFSPLPPLPAVLAAAESPISSYMRFFQSSISSFSSALPRWNSVAQPSQQQQQPPPASSSTASPLSFPTHPLSPLPFGCMPSPRSPYAVPSPSLFLPTGQLGFPQLPLSPTLPVPSPRWKNM